MAATGQNRGKTTTSLGMLAAIRERGGVNLNPELAEHHRCASGRAFVQVGGRFGFVVPTARHMSGFRATVDWRA